MKTQHSHDEGDGIRRRVEELSDIYSGKSRKKGIHIPLTTIVPIVLVFIIAFLFKQGL